MKTFQRSNLQTFKRCNFATLFFDRTIQNIKNLNRAREIIQILLKYGFEDIVINTPLRVLIPESRRLTWLRQTKSIFEYSRWERIRMATEEFGPTFIKFAQVLSNRPDVLPLPLIKELEKLQSQVPPFSIETARTIIEQETKQPIEELFEYFLDKPIGSASIGQVHRAKFKDGDEIVIKVQRPNIRNVVETDLSIMMEIATRTESYLESQGIANIIAVVEAFDKVMQKELDYRIEARNMIQFRSFYDKHLDFYVPKVYKEYSTSTVLVSEFISGCKITDVETIRSWGLEPKKLADKGISIYLDQIFKYGLFHADPHPGNVLVRKDGVICLIDFGMVGQLMKKDKFAFAGIFVGMAQQDARKMATSLRRLAIEDNVQNKRAFEYELSEIIEDFAGMDMQDSSMADLGNRLQALIYTHRLKVPRSIFLILRALAILEGIGKQLHPDLNISQLVRPYGAKIVQEQFTTENLTEEILYRVLQMDSYARNLPSEMIDVLRKFRKGEVDLQLHHHGYEPLIERLNKGINRLALTMIIVALILSSSLFFLSPHIHPEVMTSEGYPYISIVGYTLAWLLTLLLFWYIWRGRK